MSSISRQIFDILIAVAGCIFDLAQPDQPKKRKEERKRRRMREIEPRTAIEHFTYLWWGSHKASFYLSGREVGLSGREGRTTNEATQKKVCVLLVAGAPGYIVSTVTRNVDSILRSRYLVCVIRSWRILSRFSSCVSTVHLKRICKHLFCATLHVFSRGSLSFIFF